VHWVQDELERDGPALRGVLSEEDKRLFTHELDMMWSTLSQVIPAERPREFCRKGGAS
jgi:hypothetical protein